MAIFKNNKKQQTPQNSQEALERAQKSGTDKRVYGDLLYKCRRCGYEGRINNIPNIDKIAWVLMNGNQSQTFMTTNFYLDPDTKTVYKECMHHECAPGQYGYMELIGADIKGQIFLADKYKKHDDNPSSYNPDNEIPLEDLF